MKPQSQECPPEIELARIVNRFGLTYRNNLATMRCSTEQQAERALQLLRVLGRTAPARIQRVVTWRLS